MVAQNTTPVTHYAVYYCESGAVIYGTAQLLVGYGWLFRADDNSWFEVVSRSDVMRGKVEICGVVALADAQLALDVARRDAERIEVLAGSAA